MANPFFSSGKTFKKEGVTEADTRPSAPPAPKLPASISPPPVLPVPKPSVPDLPPAPPPPKPKDNEPPERTFAPAIDHTSKSDEEKSYEDSVSKEAKLLSQGIAGDHLVEAQPKYISTPSEIVYSNENGSFIVLGRDRSGSRLSGYGGKGDTKCGSIDIVVGRLGFQAAKVNEANQQLFVDPSFKHDAARIYISQKTDVDANFGLADGTIGPATTKSAIALKADSLRLISREGIKIVTGTDKLNSQGGACRSIQGLDIIAGNDDSSLQPMVLGNNLSEALIRLTHHVDKLAGIVDAFLHSQMEFNSHISTHWHTSPFFALPTLPSETLVPEGVKCAMNQLTKVKRGLYSLKANLAGFQITYLKKPGKLYICSRWNNVN